MADPLNTPFDKLSAAGLPAGPDRPLKRGRVVLRRETAHRGGKTVVVIHEFGPQITAEQIAALARRLKQSCGCGGTIKGRTIEIQGDQPGQIRALLEAEGFHVAGVR